VVVEASTASVVGEIELVSTVPLVLLPVVTEAVVVGICAAAAVVMSLHSLHERGQ
jgi:hypothetical protein